jgi:hypothetical protein
MDLLYRIVWNKEILHCHCFILEYAIRKVHEYQDELELNLRHQFLTYDGDVNLLSESIHTIKKNAEIPLDTSKEVGLETGTKKTVCSCLVTRTKS